VLADDRVFLIEDDPGARSGLESALRIQLTGAAEIETRPRAPGATSLPGRIAAATELVRAEGALLVVWAEGPVQLADGSQEAVLYAVGQREGRAQLEVVRVPGGSGPDMDRLLALKVRAVVDELRTRQSGLVEPAQNPEQGEVGRPPRPEEPETEQPAAYYRWSAALAAGVAASPLARSDFGQWGVAASAGPMLVSERLRFAGTLELGWYPGIDLASGGESVSFHEIAPGLALQAALRVGGVWLGARTGPELAFVSASGQSTAGTRGSSAVRVPLWLVGAYAEIALGAGFGASLGLDVQMRLRRQRFAVDSDEVADLGRVRPFARLLLTWTPAPRD
jgi:hypothetical protein